jgi:MFS family permease
MPLYAATIFFSAFLLFLLQPITAKQILPWFGGSAAVWTTCLVFFQMTLLLGYAYSDAVTRRLSPGAQVRLHIALLALSCALLPIVPGAQWKPLGSESPSLLILDLLAATIGLPYFLLSTTSPLVQAWFARSFPGKSPYRLFALSNLASMLALLGYPFALEPWVTTRVQSYGWSGAYVAFALLTAASGWFSLSARPGAAPVMPAGDGLRAASEAQPMLGRQLLWMALAATGSYLLLAVSNHICQNIASIPLLWIAPLSIYLLSFILCFDSTRWYRREIFLAMLAAALGVMAWTLADQDLTHQLQLQIGVFCTGLFVACMFCHGELARLKPAPRYLTRFYLMIALGGAIGSSCLRISSSVSDSSSAPRCSCCKRVASTRSSWCSASRRSSSRSELQVGQSTASTRTRSPPRAISTACCACRNGTRARQTTTARSSMAPSCTARNTRSRSSSGSRRPTTRNRPVSAARSNPCTRRRDRCGSASSVWAPERSRPMAARATCIASTISIPQ